jgi:hypothetical protein
MARTPFSLHASSAPLRIAKLIEEAQQKKSAG